MFYYFWMARKTYYDDLGVKKTATNQEIERAYRKYRAGMDKVDAAPDRQGESRMKSAYETLMDPDRRAKYDEFLVPQQRKREWKGVGVAFAVVIIGAGAALAWQMFKPPPPPAPGSLSVADLTHKAGQAMSRVESMDMSGATTVIGLAFALDDGTVATTCTGITPMSQLTLNMLPRKVPVKVAQVDETVGVCKLSAAGIGGWPLPVTSADPAPGDVVYMTKMNANGEVSLVDATVKKISASPHGRSIDVSVAVLPERVGGPVLNAFGHVVGVQLMPADMKQGEVVRITPDWAVKKKPVEPPAPAVPPATPESPETGKGDQLRVKSRAQVEAERRDFMEKEVEKLVK